ncbi:hypothetical protein SAMN05216325_1282 [Nitrosomonas marina]|uniref:Uncharacterized protein n=1 Tax=Nitrosomonas marina TaxID=917 RepID=A0A1H8HZY3_9PROT|nr:hypothetical protein SAMN05216325_1282 [Nitrosomonas marina]
MVFGLRGEAQGDAEARFFISVAWLILLSTCENTLFMVI